MPLQQFRVLGLGGEAKGAAFRRGLEVVELEVDRRQLPLQGRVPGQVGELQAAVTERELLDPDHRQGLVRLPVVGQREIRQVDRTVGPYHGTRQRRIELHVLEDERALPQ